MASLTMTAPFLGCATTTQCPSVKHRTLVMAKAASSVPEEAAKATSSNNSVSINCRRAAMFAAAAAAVSAVQGMAVAEEPKRGSPEAKKVYAPVCVTMPTARICRY